MHSISLARIPRRKLLETIFNIEFFDNLRRADAEQLKLLLEYSKVCLCDPGEMICRKGDFDSIFYFLLKGELQVFLEEPSSSAAIGRIYPGEMFGTLAMVRDSERNATIVVDQRSGKALLFAIDFSPFGDLHDFSIISHDTKHFLYKLIAEDTRRQLLRYEQAFPADPMVEKFRALESQKKISSAQSLETIFTASCELAKLLCDWNSQIHTKTEINIPSMNNDHRGDLVAGLESLLFTEVSLDVSVEN